MSDNPSPLARFQASLAIDYEKWHDGVGYDLDALAMTEGPEREQAERLLTDRVGSGRLDWRDVEALAALDTPSARVALTNALEWATPELRTAIARYAPDLVPEQRQIDAIVEGLTHADFYGGLSQALDAAEELHPPEVIDALLLGTLNRQGDGPVHFAAMLLYLHDQAETNFDDDKRDFFLRFNTAVRSEREAVFIDLCGRIGVDPAAYLAGGTRR